MILRRRGSTKVSGTLTCPRCGSAKLKFVETQGFEIDIYKCRECNTPIRYMTTPMTQSEFLDVKFGGRMARGVNPRECVNLQGLGKFRVKQSKDSGLGKPS